MVATDAPGVRDIIRGGENGIATKAGDVRAFAEALAEVLRNPELASSLRAKALSSIKGNDWPAVAERYRAFYETILAVKRA